MVSIEISVFEWIWAMANGEMQRTRTVHQIVMLFIAGKRRGTEKQAVSIRPTTTHTLNVRSADRNKNEKIKNENRF